jgi:hypothetical protein
MLWLLLSGYYNLVIEPVGSKPALGTGGAVRLKLSWPEGWRKLLAKCATENRAKKKDATMGIVPVELTPDATEVSVKFYRGTWAIILDIDKGITCSCFEAISRIKETIQWAFAWWETWTSTPEKPRLRLAFPLAAAVNGRVAQDLWDRLAQVCPFPVDRTSRERKRIALLPPSSRQWGIEGGTGLLDPAAYGWKPSDCDLDNPAGLIRRGRPAKKAAAPAPMVEQEDGEESDEDEETESSDDEEEAPRSFKLTGEETITGEDGTEITISDLTPAWASSRFREGEDRARCTCPFSDSGTLSGFLRVHDSRAFIHCRAGSHGHEPGATWVYLLTQKPSAGMGRLPYPYLLGLEGALMKEKTNSKGDSTVETVSSYCPTVTALYVDRETGDEWWRLEWTGALGHKALVLRRDECATAQKLSDRTARAGLSIHEGNRKELTVFLSEYVNANKDTLPRHRVASRMGWFPDGFQWGRQWLDFGGSGEAQELVVSGRSGEHGLAEACHSAGSLAGWARGFMALTAYPLACAGVIGAAASPVYAKIPSGMSHMLEWGAGNGTGKTSAMRMAESVWGQPEELESSWDMTAVGLENVCGFLNAIPIFLDDTQTVQDGKRNRIDPEKTVYRIVSGEGAVKGAPGGMTAEQKVWNLGAFSTGEAAIHQSRQAGGMRARLVSIQSPPFGLNTKDKVSAIVGPIAETMKANYGWLGPEIVKLLWAADPAILGRRFAKYRAQWQPILEAAGHGASDRASIHFANLHIAAHLIEFILAREGLDEGRPRGWLVSTVLTPLAAAVGQTEREAGSTDPALRARFGFWSFLVAHRGMFWSKDAREQRELYGKWEGGDGWKDLYFNARCLGAYLSDDGYNLSVNEATKRWAEEGFIDPAGHKGRLFNVSMGGARDWMYRITRDAVDKLLDSGPRISGPPTDDEEPVVTT